MLVTCIFSSFYNVFKRLLFQGPKVSYCRQQVNSGSNDRYFESTENILEKQEKILAISIFSFFPHFSNPYFFNSLPNDKILDVTKLKTFVDDKINVDAMMVSYQHFLLCPQCFQKASFLGVVKSRDCMVMS